MGEHPDDKSIESILAEEARQRALTQARQEAHQLRKSVEKELTQLIDYKPLDSLEQVTYHRKRQPIGAGVSTYKLLDSL